MGFLQEIIPLCGSILQAGTCQIFSLAEDPRWSRVWQYIWAVLLTLCIFLLQLKKIGVLEPSVWVLPGFQNINCWLIPKIQVWRHQELKVPNFYMKVKRGLGPLKHGLSPIITTFQRGPGPHWMDPPLILLDRCPNWYINSNFV